MAYLGDILVLGLGASGVAATRYCAGRLGDDVHSVVALDAADSPELARIAPRSSPHWARRSRWAATQSRGASMCASQARASRPIRR